MRRLLRWTRTLIILLGCLALLSVSLGSTATPVGAEQPDKFKIRFKTHELVPKPGLDLAAVQRAADPSGRLHFLVQFQDLQDSAGRQSLAAQGINLLNYITGNTYIAAANVAGLSVLRTMPAVRWVGPLDVSDKISQDLQAGNIGKWARYAEGQAVFIIQVHPDVAIADAEALVTRLGGKLIDSAPVVPSVTAVFQPGQAQRIAREDIVQYVDLIPPPLEGHNDGARAAANVTPLAAAPYSLNGTGVTVLVYDVGQIDNGHPDFAGRILTNDGSTVANHSTHVGGTVGGSGANSNGSDSAGNLNGGTANQWAGMAPNVNLRSFGLSGSTDTLYDIAGDLNADFTTAIGQGIDIATMSLGNNTNTNGYPCSQEGDYTNTSILIDNIVRGSISNQQLIFTESAGNERQAGARCGTYGTISSPAPAKNSIVVGAINSNDNSMTLFSSWGPTDDGRLKPDIVGPGCQSNGDSGITSPDFIDADPDGTGPLRPNGWLDPGETRNAYVVKCGTSMSTPATAGSLALIVQQWQSTHGAGTRPLAHAAKAILIHTATDLGNAGPDFQFGWGAFNARAAVDLVRANDSASLIHVDQVDNGQTDHYTFNSDGSANVRVTLVWSDPAATRLAATTLINNLDLRLVAPDGTLYQPFILDPANPANAATTGNDTRNNVEVVVGNASAGTWEVRVAGAAVPTGPQQYTLITPTNGVLNQRPVANAGGPYKTNEGTDVALNGSASSDPDGGTLTYEWDFDNDGAFDDATGATPTFSLVGQDGVYTVRLRVSDPSGAFSIASTTVTVNNVKPSFTGLTSNAPKNENSQVTVTGGASDPGWLDTLTMTADWKDGSPVQTLSGAQITASENVRPDATVAFSVSHVYGDDGTFTPQFCVADDDTSTCQNISLQIDNVNPSATIDTSTTTLVNGVPTFLAHAGSPLNFSGNSTDPGSDDLTTLWAWADGTADSVTTSLVNPPNPDPPLSPSIQPRNINDTKSHTFADACFYVIGFRSTDDDGGSSPVAKANVTIVGNASLARSAGYWGSIYGGRGTKEFSEVRLNCYLAVTRYMSAVFPEKRALATIEDAQAVLKVNQNKSSLTDLLDMQLLAAWLNFANGAIGFTGPVDTNGDGIADTPFNVAIATAESVRLNPASTRDQLEEQKDIVERINLRNGG